MLFKVCSSVVLSIVATISLFFIIYITAYFIVTGAIMTGRKIKDKYNETSDKQRGPD